MVNKAQQIVVGAKNFAQVRVVASPEGFFVKDAVGRNLQVLNLDISVRSGKPPLLRLGLIAGTYDVVGFPVFVVADPADGKPRPVRRLEFFDGTAVEFPAPPDMQAAVPPAPEGNGARPVDGNAGAT